MQNHIQHTINEVDRLIVVFPTDKAFYRSLRMIPLAFDMSAAGTIEAKLVGDGHGLGLLADYEVFYRLCDGRVQMAVDGSLRVSGAVMTPERYLKLWRTAMATPLPVSELEARHGLRLLAVLEGQREMLKTSESRWEGYPFACLADMASVYGGVVELADGRFRLEVDLSLPNGARDASWADAFLWPARRNNTAATRLELHTCGPRRASPLQPDLEGGDVVPD